MRKLGLITLAAAALAAGCDESTGPSVLAESYALARIGLLAPPIPLGPDGGPPFLLADTLDVQRDVYYGLYMLAVVGLFVGWAKDTGQ